MDLMMLSDKDVLDYVAPNGKLIPARCSKSILKKHNLYDYVVNRYDNNTLNKKDKYYLRECLYRIFNHIETPPVCKICGNPLIFTYTKYLHYCSRSCSNKDIDVLKKISMSCSNSLKKAYEQNGDDIKRKRKETLSQKYGVEINSSSPFAINEIQNQSQEKIIEKYGVKSVFQLESVRKKRIKSQRESSIKLQKERGIEIEYTNYGTYLVKNCCKIHGDLEFTQIEFNNRFREDRYQLSNPCYYCNPFGYNISGAEKTLLDYIKSIYSGTILENYKEILDGKEIDIYLPDLKIGFEFQGDYWHMNPMFNKYDYVHPTYHITAEDKWCQDRHKLILAESKGITLFQIWEYHFVKDKESVFDFISNVINKNIEYKHPLIKLKTKLDEINTDYKLINDMIFEYDDTIIVYMDGFYSGKKSITKEYLKSFIKKDKRTIFVYDYEILDERKFDIIISDIKYALHKIENKIYARKCKLKEITNTESKVFLIENSLFGYRSASVILGLYYNDELVMVYSFGNNYYGRKNYTEIIRVCTKKNTQVIGGSSKCLKYYIDKFGKEDEVLIFYVDAIHHNGESMKTDDFKYIRHEFGFMNYYISFDQLGMAFNRTPGRNKEIKKMIEDKKIIEVLTNGVYVYKKIIKL